MSKRKSSVAQARAVLDNIESDASYTEGSTASADTEVDDAVLSEDSETESESSCEHSDDDSSSGGATWNFLMFIDVTDCFKHFCKIDNILLCYIALFRQTTFI
jgi:hypothetical protein